MHDASAFTPCTHHSEAGTKLCFVINSSCASQDLASDLEAGDGQAFADHLAEFDSMTRLDKWKTTLLLKVTCTLPGPRLERPCIMSGHRGPQTVYRSHMPI